MSHRRGRIWDDKVRGDGMRLTSRPLSEQERRASPLSEHVNAVDEARDIEIEVWMEESYYDDPSVWDYPEPSRSPLKASFLTLAAS